MAKRRDTNFKKAMDELLGAGAKQPETKQPEAPLPEVKQEVKEEAPKAEPVKMKPVLGTVDPEKREEAVIPADMLIEGNITTVSNMQIYGNIVGDVSSEGNINLIGNIQGNVKAGNLTIVKGTLTGDVCVKENILLEQESLLKGNLMAQNVYSNASIEGQITAEGMVELKSQANVQGDIIAKSVSMISGAKVKGVVNVSE